MSVVEADDGPNEGPAFAFDPMTELNGYEFGVEMEFLRESGAVIIEHRIALPHRDVIDDPKSLAHWRRNVLPARAWTILSQTPQGGPCQWCGEDVVGHRTSMTHPQVYRAKIRVCDGCVVALAGSDGTPGCEPLSDPEQRKETLESGRYSDHRRAERTIKRVRLAQEENWTATSELTFLFTPPWNQVNRIVVSFDIDALENGGWMWDIQFVDDKSSRGGPLTRMEDAHDAIANAELAWRDE